MQKDSFWVLIIEDDLFQATLCTKYLRRFSTRFEVLHVTSGTAALEELEHRHREGFGQRQPIILLDYYLPDGTGAEFLPRFLNLIPQAIAIVITASESWEMSSGVLNAGASDYIHKSFDYYKHLPRVIEVACDRWMLRHQLEQELAHAQQRELAALEERRQLELVLMSELKNPLTDIIDATHLLQHHQTDEHSDQAVETIAKQANQALKIVNELLTKRSSA